jgi:hypothetical protein
MIGRNNAARKDRGLQRQHNLSDMVFGQKGFLGRHNVEERKCFCDQWLDFSTLDISDQIAENFGFKDGAADERKVL